MLRRMTVLATGIAVLAVCAVVIGSAAVLHEFDYLRGEPTPPPVEKPVVYPPLEAPPGYIYTEAEFRRCEWWGPPRDCLPHVHWHVVHNMHGYVVDGDGKAVTTAATEEFAPACSLVGGPKPPPLSEHWGTPNGLIDPTQTTDNVKACQQYPWVSDRGRIAELVREWNGALN